MAKVSRRRGWVGVDRRRTRLCLYGPSSRLVTESRTPSCTPSSCCSSVFLLLFISSFRAILSDISSHTRTHCPYLCLDRVCRSWKNVTQRDRRTGRASVLNATVKFAFPPSISFVQSFVRSSSSSTKRTATSPSGGSPGSRFFFFFFFLYLRQRSHLGSRAAHLK